jgi:hypothetical protein
MAEGSDRDTHAASDTEANAGNDPAQPAAASGAGAEAGSDEREAGPFLPMIVAAPERGARAEDFDFIEAGADANAEATAQSQPLWRRHAPLAAGIALAVTVGALAGAGATAGLLRDSAAPPPAAPATAAASISVEVLQGNVARLEEELAALKAGIGSAQRSASAQFGKLAERLDRAEKAHAASDITGSVPAAKPASQPPLAEGWRLRDYYAGRAVVESRATGRLFSASLEPRRPPYYLPYRY